MEGKSQNNLVEAKVVFLSIAITLLVIAALIFSFKKQIISTIVSTIESDVSEMIPPMNEQVTFQDKVVSAIEKVNPAVVSVIVTKDVPVYEQYYETVNPWGLFDGFAVPRIRENGTEEKEIGGGSGFIVSSDGLIVTNRHVVDDPDARYSILISDGTVYDVEVIDRDSQLDIAILKISMLPEKQLPYVSFGDSTTLRLGDSVIAIGNALAEFQNSVSFGIVSGLGRSIVASDNFGNSEQLNQVIQTDAAINPGNSGGPLLNLEGEVIGVNVATSRGADNIGFALPGHLVQQVVESVREHGEIIRPFLGVRYTMVDTEVQEELSLSVDFGALVIEGSNGEPGVEPGSPADESGIVVGDIITTIDDVSLNGKDLATELRNKSYNDEVTLTIVRDDKEETVFVVLDRAI